MYKPSLLCYSQRSLEEDFGEEEQSEVMSFEEKVSLLLF